MVSPPERIHSIARRLIGLHDGDNPLPTLLRVNYPPLATLRVKGTGIVIRVFCTSFSVAITTGRQMFDGWENQLKKSAKENAGVSDPR